MHSRLLRSDCARLLRSRPPLSRQVAHRGRRSSSTAVCSGADVKDHSQAVYQELVLLLVLNESEIAVNRALLREQFDVLSDARQKRDRVDELLQLLQQKKLSAAGGGGGGGAAPPDTVTQGLQLRVQLNQAIEDQRFEEAAQLKARLEGLSATSGGGAGDAGALPAEARRFQLGQVVEHARDGYRGIVFGWDAACVSEADGWKAKQDLGALQRGEQQPFYYVMAVSSEEASSTGFEDFPTTYAAEELLKEAAEEDRRRLHHPLAYALFLGKDADHNFIPSSSLRRRFR